MLIWQMDRQKGRQTEWQTDGQTDRWRDRQTDRHTYRQRNRQTDGERDGQTNGEWDKQIEGQTDRQAGRQAGRQADRWTKSDFIGPSIGQRTGGLCVWGSWWIPYLFNTLYSNIEFSLDREYLQAIIKKNENLFFSMWTSTFGWPQYLLMSAAICYGWPPSPQHMDMLYGWALFPSMSRYWG